MNCQVSANRLDYQAALAQSKPLGAVLDHLCLGLSDLHTQCFCFLTVAKSPPARALTLSASRHSYPSLSEKDYIINI